MISIKKTSGIILTLFMCICMTAIPIYATNSQDGLEVSLVTDKDTYNKDENIEVTLSVTNTNNESVRNLSMENMIPEGYVLSKETEATKKVESLEPGQKEYLNVVYIPQSKSVGETTPSGNSNKDTEKADKPSKNNKGITETKITVQSNNTVATNNTNGTVTSNNAGSTRSTNGNQKGSQVNNSQTNNKSSTAPSTGDNSKPFKWISLIVISGIIIYVTIKREFGKKLLSIFLVVSMIGTISAITYRRVEAADFQRSISMSKKITVGTESIIINASLSYEINSENNVDSDGDGVADYIEEYLKTNPQKNDTDSDGLSDYIEIYTVHTDPLKKDTDDDGVNDGEEDADEDGLTNLEELEKGTDPVKVDTDADGLTDGEEINQYGTHPVEYDTDSDTISDGDEILLGLDPLNPTTDGVTPDAGRTFEQTLDDDYIDESLNQDNIAIPSIKGIVPGNINRHVSIEEINIPSLEDNRATVGKAVLIDTDYSEDVDLRLVFSCDEEDDRFGFYLICQYLDGELFPCETKEDKYSLYTTANNGVYFVIDAEQLLIDLGIPIAKYRNYSVDKGSLSDDEIIVGQSPSSNVVSDEWYNENYSIVDKNGVIVEGKSVLLDSDIEKSIGEVSLEYSTDVKAKEVDEISDIASDCDNSERELGEIKSNFKDENISEESIGANKNEDSNSNNDSVLESELADTEEITSISLEDNEQLVLSSTLDSIKTSSVEQVVGNASGQADIVFVIDTTGSMSGAINNVARNIDSFVDTLKTDYSVAANFALIDFKDITCNEDTILVNNGSNAWFSDVDKFKAKINSLFVEGGGDDPETAIDGLAMAQKLDFRQNASKFIILVTDADYKNDNNYGIRTMDEMTELLLNSGIIASVVSDPYFEPEYHGLYSNTGGVFGDIYGDFKSVLLALAENIGEIVNDGSWVILSDYQFIKLDQPLDDSGYSSDEDSLSDVEELGEQVERDVMPYITWVLNHYNIPEGMYDDSTTVKVYKYKSNPLLADTDYDGRNDDLDSFRRDNSFSGELSTDYAKSKVSLVMDYRWFYGDRTIYNEKLSRVC